MKNKLISYVTFVIVLLIILSPQYATAQSFDYDRLYNIIKDYTVIVDVKMEVSFGVHTNEQADRYLGTIVTDDGLVIFNGFTFNGVRALSSFSGFSIKTTPTEIKITTLDGKKYDGEYIGVDRYTQIGFIKIKTENNEKFKPVKFQNIKNFKVGSWVTLYTLLPDFVNPPVAADIGMISTVVKTPQFFPLTVGFNSIQLTSVLFNEALEPVGVLGELNNPSSSSFATGGLMESSNPSSNMTLLGIVTGEQLEKLIANPPQKGKTDHSWLGITLQALTKDMAQFWHLDIPGGIIVNDVMKNSPADNAGLEVGDIIYKVNGQQVEIDKEEKIPIFQRLISEMEPGTSVEFSVLRRAQEGGVDSLTLLATLQKAPMAAMDAPEYENKDLEFKVRNLVFSDYLYYNLDSATFHGVVVSALTQGGLADIEGLSMGDIIQKINNQPVNNIDDVKEIMKKMKREYAQGNHLFCLA
ncbi:MAG: PDZ domain-containing protein [FCB group bacterium]|nr:PDZ domain-containing protein [FCB group bacterium]